jgi:hypothetical protein
MAERRAFLQQDTGCSLRVAELLIRQCPLVDRPNLSAPILRDLAQRAKCLDHLEKLQEGLHRKYPALNNEARASAFRAQEIFFVTLPVCLGEKEMQRFACLTSVLRELVEGNYDSLTAGMILDRLLARESRHGAASDLHDHLRLLALKRLVKGQIVRGQLVHAEEASYKDIYVIPSVADKQGKFKPLPPGSCAKEVHAYRCDRALGIGMSAPTLRFKFHFVPSLVTIQELFRAAVLLDSQKNRSEAQRQRQRAIAQLNAPDFPEEVRNAIFGEMYALCGEGRQEEDLGKMLMLDSHHADRCKALAIDNYMHSPAFPAHVARYQFEGSVQIWQKQCSASAFDYLVQDPNGGQKLGSAPKVLVHFYALLGMLKGSMDCSSNNTLVEFSEEASRIASFWDMDDERSMPSNHNSMQIRLWQMGLPQCAQPFDRAFLLLFSDLDIVTKLQRIQTSPQIAFSGYGMQLERVHTILTLFQAELVREEITLTPRDLYFTLFPGSREEFGRIGEVFPIEAFEFHLNEMGRSHIGKVGGREACYSKVDRVISRGEFEAERRRIDANMRALQNK